MRCPVCRVNVTTLVGYRYGAFAIIVTVILLVLCWCVNVHSPFRQHQSIQREFSWLRHVLRAA
jgi:hypothetical protein